VVPDFAKNNLKMTQNADNFFSLRVFWDDVWFADNRMAISEGRL